MKIQALKNFGEKLEPWIVCVWLLYFFGFDALAFLGKIIKVVSYPVLFFLIVGRLQRFAYFATRDISLLLLVGMAMLSVFWSAAPDFTSIETKAVLRATLFGVYLAMRFSMKEQMKLLAWVLGIGVVCSLLVGLAMPSYGIISGDDETVWKGVFGFKNLFASIMTLAALLFLLIALDEGRKRWLSWSLFGIAGVLLFLSKGKTAYSVFFISLSLLPFHKFVKQHDKLRVVLFLIGILISGSAIVLFLSNLEFIVVDTLGKNMEFNGRMPIWTLIFHKILERPWLGYGVSGFWTSDEALYVLYNSWGEGAIDSGNRFNAHSGYLDLCLTLGFLGFFLYVFNFLAVFTRTVNLWIATRSIEFFWVLQVLVVFFLLNFTDSISILGTGSTWTIYVSMTISTATQQTRMRKQCQLSKVPVAG